APRVHVRDRRRAPGDLRSLLTVRRLVAIRRAGVAVRVIVHAVDVDAGGEDVGVACERHGRQVAAVGAAPYADAARVDLRQRSQVLARGDDVLVLRGALCPCVRWPVEVEAVADAEPVVYGERDEAAAREVLLG